MIPFGRCFLPGPTDVRPEIYAATAQPMFFHRGPRMVRLLKEIQPSLQVMFGTARPVFTATSSATGLAEAAVRSGVRHRVAVVVGGSSASGSPASRRPTARGDSVRRAVRRDDRARPARRTARRCGGGRRGTGAFRVGDRGVGPVGRIGGGRQAPARYPVARGCGDRSWRASAPDGCLGSGFHLHRLAEIPGAPPGLALGAVSEAFVARAREVRGRGSISTC